jgi:hypothetical protein
MKKLLFLSLFVITSLSSFSQITIDSLNVKAAYCEIVGTQGFLSSKLTIRIDYGQDSGSIFNPKDSRLKGEDGKAIKFNSMIDVLNLMHIEGWNFVTAYIIGDAQRGYVYHWLLKRKS